MDVIYCFGDSFNYRTPARDYEQFPIEQEHKKAQSKPTFQKHQNESKSSHENCQMCKDKAKEQKRRPLKKEIKRCANRTESICEEIEEC